MVFNKQHSLFGQYKVVLDNKEEILNLIEKANINDSNEVHDFYELGILLIKLFFGKNCILFRLCLESMAFPLFLEKNFKSLFQSIVV